MSTAWYCHDDREIDEQNRIKSRNRPHAYGQFIFDSGPHLAPNAKTYSKWIIDLNVEFKTIALSE